MCKQTTHVIANPNTAHILGRYTSERGAKIAKTRKYKDDDMAQIYNLEFYNQFIDTEVTVYSIFDLKEENPITIRKSDKALLLMIFRTSFCTR